VDIYDEVTMIKQEDVSNILLEQTQEMYENSAMTPHPVTDKQRSNSGKESSDKVVIGAELG